MREEGNKWKAKPNDDVKATRRIKHRKLWKKRRVQMNVILTLWRRVMIPIVKINWILLIRIFLTINKNRLINFRCVLSSVWSRMEIKIDMFSKSSFWWKKSFLFYLFDLTSSYFPYWGRPSTLEIRTTTSWILPSPRLPRKFNVLST